MDEEKRREYTEALNTYYKLKTAYENAYNKDKNKIIKMKDLSWKEKRVEFSKLKPNCINCKRAVGTLFYTSKDKGERALFAKCGDKSNPCPLNIAINLGYIVNLENELANDEKTIADEKREIIADKKNVIIIEWADRIAEIIPKDALWAGFEWIDEKKRKIILNSKFKI